MCAHEGGRPGEHEHARPDVSGAEGRAEERDLISVEHIVRARLEEDGAGFDVAHQPPDIMEDDAETGHRGAVVQPDIAAGALDGVDEDGGVGMILDGLASFGVGDHGLVVDVDLDADGVARLVEERDKANVLRARREESDAARAGADFEGPLVDPSW
jgi:hypothetical protein